MTDTFSEPGLARHSAGQVAEETLEDERMMTFEEACERYREWFGKHKPDESPVAPAEKNSISIPRFRHWLLAADNGEFLGLVYGKGKVQVPEEWPDELESDGLATEVEQRHDGGPHEVEPTAADKLASLGKDLVKASILAEVARREPQAYLRVEFGRKPDTFSVSQVWRLEVKYPIEVYVQGSVSQQTAIDAMESITGKMKEAAGWGLPSPGTQQARDYLKSALNSRDLPDDDLPF